MRGRSRRDPLPVWSMTGEVLGASIVKGYAESAREANRELREAQHIKLIDPPQPGWWNQPVSPGLCVGKEMRPWAEYVRLVCYTDRKPRQSRPSMLTARCNSSFSLSVSGGIVPCAARRNGGIL